MPALRDVIIILGSILFILIESASCNKGCKFNVTNNDTEKYQPVPLYNISSDYELAVPSRGSIHLKQGQNISLLCSGTRNYVRKTNSNVTTVTCIEGNEVKLYREILKFEDVQCKKIVKGDVRATNERCGNNRGLIYQIGYPVSRKDWITLIKVCYVPETGSTLYTNHIIHGKEIKHASKAKYRPGFSTAGQHVDITASSAYTQAFQKSSFNKILGSSVLAKQYIHDKSFLAKGHLSPDADFLLATAQFSTYYYINAAPQWQSINGASWKSIENTVRELAAHHGNLEIFTGTHGILNYRDINNNPQDIFLGKNETLPVPKYFWKVVFDPKTSTAIAFVILNDPFVKLPEEHVFCNDICKEKGFSKATWKEPSSGFVFCCSFDDFQNVVQTMPKLEIFGVLGDPLSDGINVELSRLRINDI